MSPGVRLDSSPPKTLGPYRIEAVLGQGGMGVVYAGVDAQGRRAAIKTIGALRSHALMIAFRAEVHALRRVHHPGVVAFWEEGLTDPVPWYAMDLIAGPTLAAINNGVWAIGATDDLSEGHSTVDAVTAETVATSRGQMFAPGGIENSVRHFVRPELLAQILSVYRHVSAALGHVHRRGLIHRDLKPTNILMAESGRPVLVDFGLVSRAGLIGGRETMDTDASGFLGSPAYMAPEQIRGDSVDARTDLYALGCMLFESLTGRTPFVADSARDMLDCHLGVSPPSPSEAVDGIPARLADLVCKLLAKAPHDRPGHADDCQRELAELGGTLSEDYATSESDHARIFFYRPRPAGRSGILDKLFAQLDEAKKITGSFVLIKGESGSGKTFVVTELARRARRNRISTVSGECPPIGYGDGNEERSSAPLVAIRALLQLVADRCRAGGLEITDRLLGPRCRILVKYEPTLEHVPGFGKYQDPPETTPGASRERVLAAVRDTLAALSTESPLLWIVDDLQWADELSLDLMASLDRDFCRQHALMVAGTCRSDEISPALSVVLDLAVPEVVALDGLRTEDVAMMTADMLAVESAPRALVEYLATRGRGNPFFVAEYLRVAATTGILVRSNGRWQTSPNNDWSDGPGGPGVDLPVPAAIKDLISRRIATLPERAKIVLETAAVLGHDLDLELLVAILLDTEATLESVAVLREKQVFTGEGGRLQFVHDQIAEQVYSDLSDRRRRGLHENVARVLERSSDGPSTLKHRALAHHWGRAGHLARSASHLYEAARLARESWANEEAVRLYREAIDLAAGAASSEGGQVLAVAREGLGDVLTLTGESEAAAENYVEVLPALVNPLDVGRLHRKRGHALSDSRLYDETLAALAAAESALVLCTDRTHAWWQEWIEVQNELIWLRYWTAQPDHLTALLPLVDRVRGPVEAHGSASQRTRLPYMLSLAALRRDRFRSPEGLQFARACARAAEESDQLLTRAESRFHLGFVLATNDDPAEGERILTEVVDDAHRLRHAHLEVRAQAYLSVAQRRLQAPAARQSAERTIDLATKSAMPMYVAVGYANRGACDFRAGEVEQAANDLESALSLWRTGQPVYPFKWLAGWPLLRLYGKSARPADQLKGLLAELLAAAQQALPIEVLDHCRSALALGADQTAEWMAALLRLDESCAANALY